MRHLLGLVPVLMQLKPGINPSKRESHFFRMQETPRMLGKISLINNMLTRSSHIIKQCP